MRSVRSFAVALALLAVGCGSSSPAPSSAANAKSPADATSSPAATSPKTPLNADEIKSLLADPDRTDGDRTIDKQRHPDELLAFFGVGRGMVVADLGSGGGYTTELLAHAVGPSGKVYTQNDPEVLARFAEKMIAARVARPINAHVVRSDRKFDEPLPPDAKGLDLVVMYIFYHDTVWLGADRDKMNKAVFDALKPGGSYVIVDASAAAGHGVADAKTLHRIEENVVTSEVEKAGFKLAAKADFLRNPSDTRDWSSSPKAAGDKVGTEDRFLLKFQKP